MAACPLWVKSGLSSHTVLCLLYSRKRTSQVALSMSARCQKRNLEIYGQNRFQKCPGDAQMPLGVNSLGSSVSTSNAERYWAIQYAAPRHCGDPCSGGFSARYAGSGRHRCCRSLFGGRAAVDRLPPAARNFADGRSLRVSNNIELFAQSRRIIRWRGTGRLFDESGRHWANNGSGNSH